jgi:hypothetical protein
MTAVENIRFLLLELEAELEHFRQLAQNVSESETRFSGMDQLTLHDLRGLAMLLTEIYLGAENLMLRVCKSLVEKIPSGQNWHKELLNQLLSETEARPPLFTRKTARQLDEFRRFRHVTHHVYSFNYDWKQIEKLLILAGPLLVDLIKDVEAFKAFLLNVTATEDGE